MSLEALPGIVQLPRTNPPWGLASPHWREGRCREAHLERGCVVSQGHRKTELCPPIDSQVPNLKMNCWCWTASWLNGCFDLGAMCPRGSARKSGWAEACVDLHPPRSCGGEHHVSLLTVVKLLDWECWPLPECLGDYNSLPLYCLALFHSDQ